MSRASHAYKRLRTLWSHVLARHRRYEAARWAYPPAVHRSGPAPKLEPLEPRLMLDGTGEDAAILPGQRDELLDGLAAARDWLATAETWGEIASTSINPLGGSVGSSLNVADAFDAAILTPTSDYLAADETPTLGEWLTSLEAAATAAAGVADAAVSSADGLDFEIDLSLATFTDAADWTLDLAALTGGTDLDAWGFSLGTDEIAADVGATLRADLTFGVDTYRGFYVDAAATGGLTAAAAFDADASGVTFTAGPLSGQLGQLSGLGPTFAVTFDQPASGEEIAPGTPHPLIDGLLTVEDLQTYGLADLAARALDDDVSLSLPVAFTDPDGQAVEAAVGIAADNGVAAPAFSADVAAVADAFREAALTAGTKAAVSSLLGELATWADALRTRGAFADTMDLLGSSLGSGVDLGGLLTDGLLTPTDTYFATADNPTWAGWLTALGEVSVPGVTLADVARATGLDAGEAGVTLRFAAETALAAETLSLSGLLAGSGLDALGVSFTGDDLELSLTAAVDFALTIGLDDAGNAFVAPGDWTVGVDVTGSSDATFAVDGVLAGSLGEIAGAGPEIALTFASPTTDGRLTEANITTLADNLATLTLDDGVAVGAAMSFTSAADGATREAELGLTVADAFADATWSADSAGLVDALKAVAMSAATRTAVADILAELATWSTALNAAEELGQDMDLVGGPLGSTLDFAGMLDAAAVTDAVDYLDNEPSPSWQGLVDRLADNVGSQDPPEGVADVYLTSVAAATGLAGGEAGVTLGIHSDVKIAEWSFDVSALLAGTGLDALGLSVDAGAVTADISGAIDLEVTVGIDADGAAFVAPGSLEVSTSFAGGLPLSFDIFDFASGQTGTFEGTGPSVAAAFNAGEDGRLTLADLQTGGATLVSLTASAGAGAELPFEIAVDAETTETAVLALEAADAFDTPTFAADTAGLAAALRRLAFSPAVRDALLAGLADLSGWADGLDAHSTAADTIPLLGTSFGAALDFGGIIDDLLVTPATDYFASDATPSWEGLIAALAAAAETAADGAMPDISLAEALGRDEAGLTLRFRGTADAGTWGFDVADLLAGADLGDLGLSVPAGEAAADLAAAMDFTLTIVVDAANELFIEPGDCLIRAEFSGGTPLSFTAAGGAFEGTLGTVTGTGPTLALRFDNVDADGRIALADLVADGMSGIGLDVTRDVEVSVPLTFSTADLVLAEDAALIFRAVDGLHEPHFTADASAVVSALETLLTDPTAMSAAARTAIAGGLGELVTWSGVLSGAGDMASSIPLLGDALGDRLDVGAMLEAGVVTPSLDYFASDASLSWNEWAQALLAANAASAEGAALEAEQTVTSLASIALADGLGDGELGLDLAFRGEIGLLDASVDLASLLGDAGLSALGLDVSADELSLNLKGAYEFAFTAGVDASEAFFIEPGAMSLRLEVAADADVSFDLAETFHAALGQVTGTGPTFAATWADPNGNGRLALADLQTGGAGLVSLSTAPAVAVDLPVSFHTDAIPLPEELGIALSIADGLAGSSFSVDATELTDAIEDVLLDPGSLTVAQRQLIVAGLREAMSWATTLEGLDELGGAMGLLGSTSLGTSFDLSGVLTDGFIDPSLDYFAAAETLTLAGWASALAAAHADELPEDLPTDAAALRIRDVTVPDPLPAGEQSLSLSLYGDMNLADWSFALGDILSDTGLAALGLSADVSDLSLDINARLDWTLEMGVDGDGFFLRPSDATLAMDFTGGAEVGLDLAGLFNGTVGIAAGTGPTFTLGFTPGPDGKITTSELADATASLVSLSVDRSASVSLPVSFSTPVFELPEGLAVALTASDAVYDPTFTASAAGLVDVVDNVLTNPLALTRAQKQFLVEGFEALLDWSGCLQTLGSFDLDVPFIGGKIGESIDIGQTLRGGFITPTLDYFLADDTLTTGEWVSALLGAHEAPAGDTAFGLGSVAVADGLADGEVGVTFTLAAELDIADWTYDLDGLLTGAGLDSILDLDTGSVGVDIAATLDAEITLGVDAENGFYFSADTFTIGTEVSGGAEITVDIGGLIGGTLGLATGTGPSIDVAFDDPDGKVTYADLVGGGTDLVSLTPAADIEVSLPLSAEVGGYDLPAETSLVLVVADAFDNADFSVDTASITALTEDALFGGDGLSGLQKAAILAGIDEFRTLLGELSTTGAMAAAADILGGSLGGALDVATVLDNMVLTPSETYLNDTGSPTLQGWATHLRDANAVGGETIETPLGEIVIPELAPEDTNFYFTFSLHDTFDIADWSFDLGGMLGDMDFDDLGFGLDVSDVAVDITALVDMDMTFGVDLDGPGFYIQPGAFDIQLAFAGGGPVSLSLGMFELTTGTVTGTGPTWSVTITDPGTDPDTAGKITTDELDDGGLFGVTVGDPSASVELPLSMATSGVEIAEDVTLAFASADVLDTASFALAASNIGEVVRAAALSPQSVVAGLAMLERVFAGMDNLPIMRIDVPFTDAEVGDILDLGQAVTGGLNDLLVDDTDTDNPTARFATYDEMVAAFADTLDGVTYDAASRELRFGVDYTYDFTAFDEPLDFSLDLGPLEIATDADLSLGGSAELSFALGMLIAPERTLQVAAETNNPPTDQAGHAILDGQLGVGNDLVFDVYLDGWDHYEVTVAWEDTSTNSDLLDLVDDIDAALADAGLSGEVRALLTDLDNLGGEVTRDNYGTGGHDGSGIVGLETVTAGEYWALRVTTEAGAAQSLLGFGESATARPAMAEFFIDDTAVGVDVALTAADVDASASLGIAEISLVDGTASMAGSASGGLVHPDTGATRMTLTDILELGSRWSEMIQLDLTGSGEVRFEDIQLAGLSGAALGDDAAIEILVNDLSQPENVTVRYPDLGNLRNLKDLSISQVLSLLSSGVEFVSSMDALQFLSFDIPLLNMNLAETLDLAAGYAEKVEAAQQTADEGGSLQLLNTSLGDELGAGEGSFSLGLDGYNLKCVFDYAIGTSVTLPFNLDLASLIALAGTDTSAFDVLTGFVDMGGSATVELAASGTLHVALGLDLTDVANPRPFLYDESSLTVGVRAAAEDVSFNVSVGALGMAVRDGWAVMDADGEIGATDPATLTVSLAGDDGDGRHYFGDAAEPISADLAHDFNAAMDISLPVYFPSESIPLGGEGNNAVRASISDLRDLAAADVGAVALTAPDFASLFSGVNIIQVIANPAVVIDGIQATFDTATETLSGVIESINLPLVGGALVDGIGFVDDLADGLLSFLRTKLNEALDGRQPPELIQEALFSAFGPGGLGVLKDADSDGEVTLDDVVLDIDEESWEYIEYRVDLGQTLFNETLEFDLGLGALPLELSGAVNAALGWDWSFGFGVHVTDGLYMLAGEDEEMELRLDVTMPETLHGELFFLEADVSPVDGSGDVDYSQVLLSGAFAIDFTEPSGDGKLSLAEMRMGSVSDIISASFSGTLDADLRAVLSIGGSDQFPRMRAVLGLDWGIEKTFGQPASTGALSVAFNDVQLDLGTFVSGFLKPIFVKVDEIIEPIRPFLDFLTDPLPVVDMSLCDVGRLFGYGQYAGFIEAADWIADMASSVASMPGDELWLDMGSFALGGDVLGGESGSASIQATDMESFNSSLEGSSAQAGTKSFVREATTGSSAFELNILNPMTIFKVIMGQEAVLMTYALPDLSISASYSQYFPVWGPLGMRLGGDVGVDVHLGIGYDTYGIQKARETGNWAYVMEGFYISDRENADGTGSDVPELTAHLGFYAAAELNAGVASGGVRGGITGEATFNLDDPDDDGKVRITELWGNMRQGPQYIFDVGVQVDAYISWYVKIGWGKFSKTFDGTLAEVTLLDWSWEAESEPVLAVEGKPDEIVLNMGEFAKDRLHGDKSSDGETFTLSAGSLIVSYDGVTQEIDYSPGDTVLVEAGPGDDTLIVGAGLVVNVVFHGGAGNDRVEMHGDGWLEAYGGAGDDVIIGGDEGDTLDGGAGNDTISGGGGADTITGGAGNDSLDGGAGDDTYVYADGFGDDTLADASGSDILDLSGTGSPVTLNPVDDTAVNEAGDSVSMDVIVELVRGSSAVDTIVSDNAENTWTITGPDEGDYNDEFDWASFERLIGNTRRDAFVFEDDGYVSTLIDGGSGAEDGEDAGYAEHVAGDILDLSAYSTSVRWQVDEVDGGRLYLTQASPVFTNVENHSGGSAKDYLVLNNDRYVTGVFDGNGDEDRIEVSDYQLIGGYKRNVWDFTGYKSGSVNERTGFLDCENFTGGMNEDFFYFHPAGSYAAGFLHSPGGPGGALDGSIRAEDETDTISDSPTYREPDMFAQSLAAVAQPLNMQHFGDPDYRGVDPDVYDVIWHVTGSNSGTRETSGTSVTFSDTQNLGGSSGRDLFVIHPGGSLDGYIDGQGGDDTIVYGWHGEDWSDPTAVSFTTPTQAGATAIGGYVSNIESFVAGTNAGDTFTGANVANVWDITADDAGTIDGAVPVAFRSFENVAGGTGEDVFSFAATAAVSGSIAGGTGADTVDLSSFAGAIDWAISGGDAGTVSLDGGDAIGFAGVESVVGGTGVDTFTFAAAGELTGSIDGNDGADTLDYSAKSTDVRWAIDVQDAGRISRQADWTDFANVEHIVSGSGDDRFVFADGVGLTGTIDAGEGTDTFDYSDYSVSAPVAVDLENLTATGVTTFAGAETFLGGASMSNRLAGPDGVSADWYVTDIDDGRVEVAGLATPYVFYDIQNLVGGTGDDSFLVSDTEYVHGPIDGQGGSDTLSFAGYSLVQTWNLTGAGAGTLGMTETLDPINLAFEDVETIVSGDADDTVNFENDAAAIGSISAGGGDDVADMRDRTLAVEIDLQAQAMTTAAFFDGFETIHGSAAADTITGRDAANTWAIAADNAGTVNAGQADELAFTTIEHFVGGSDDDMYVFADGAGVSGSIDAAGEGGSGNALDYAAWTSEVAVDLQATTATGIGGTFAGIRNVTGGAGTDSLTGLDGQPNTWNVTAADAGQINAGETVFASFGNLTGGDGDEQFVFAADGSLSGTLDGAGGTNTLDYTAWAAATMDLAAATVTGTAGFANLDVWNAGATGGDALVGDDVDRTWNVTDDGAGEIAGRLTFTGVNHLTGGTADDQFVFADGRGVTGVVDGAEGSDTLNYAANTTPVTVDRQAATATQTGGISGIEALVGSTTADDTLTGLDADTDWTVASQDTGDAGGTFAFSDVENLTGGGENDAFTFEDGASLRGDLDAGAGDDTLDLLAIGQAVDVNLQAATATGIGGTFAGLEHFTGSAGATDTFTGPDADTDWSLTGADAATFAGGTMSFANFEDLTAGSGADTFALAAGASLTLGLDAAGGTDAMDYSAWSDEVSVDLQAGTASGIGTTFASVEGFTGGAGTDSLTARDGQANAWAISAVDTGTINTDETTFAGFGHLTGGDSEDTFTFADGASLTGTLDGAAGANALDTSAQTTDATMDLANATVTPAAGFANLVAWQAGTGSDTLIGDDTDRTWDLTADGGGEIVGRLTFTGVESLTGGSADDRFAFADGVSVAGVIDGAGGTDTLDYSAHTSAVTVDRQAATASQTGGFASIEAVTGSTSDADELVGADAAATWTIASQDTGDVDGAFAYAGVENLTGGSADDTFAFADGASVRGVIAAGDGTDTLDYSAYTTAVAVDLGGGTATGTAGISSVELVIAGSADNALGGPDQANTWEITDDDTVVLNGTREYRGFGTLAGGSGADTFTFADGAVLSVGLDGGGGQDHLDFSAYTTYNTWTSPTPGTVEIETRFGTFSYQGIETYQGGTSVFLFTNYDLAAGFGDLSVADVVAPGERFRIPVRVTNQGNARFRDRVDVTVYASTDATLDVGTDVVLGQLADQWMLLAQNQTGEYATPVTFPEDMTFGDYYLIAEVDSSDEFDEIDEVNNVEVTAGTTQVASVFGNLPGGRNVPLTLPQDAQTSLVFRITGPGRAAVVGDDLDAIELWETTSATTLRVTVEGDDTDAALAGITVHGDMGTILATDVDLTGDLVVEGDLRRVAMRDTAAGTAQQIRVGAVADGGEEEIPSGLLRLEFGQIADAVIQSTIPVGLLDGDAWTDTDATPDTLTAPSVHTLRIGGGMDASAAVAGDLLFADVGGTLAGQIDVTGDVRWMRLGGDLTGGLAVDGSLGTLRLAAGAADGAINVVGDAASIFVAQGLSQGVTVGGRLGLLRIGADLTGDVAVDGRLTRLTVGGDVTGSLAAGSVALASVAGALGGTTDIAGDLTTLIAGTGLGGTVTVGEDVATMLLRGGDVSGTVTVGGGLAVLSAVSGDLAGRVEVGGNVSAVRLSELSGTLYITGRLAAMGITGDLSGQAYAFDWIGRAWLLGGDLSGDLGTNGLLGSLAVLARGGSGGAVTGSLEAGDEIRSLHVAAASSGRIASAMVGRAVLIGGFSGSITATGDADEFPELQWRPHVGAMTFLHGDFTGTLTAGRAGAVYVVNGNYDGGMTFGGDVTSVAVVGTGGTMTTGSTLAVGGTLRALTAVGDYGARTTVGGDLHRATVVGDVLDGGGVRVGGRLWSAYVRGALAGGATGVQITAADIGALTVIGDADNARILVGGDLGDDWAFGGTGDDADTYAAGTLRGAYFGGNVADSLLAVGAVGDAGGIDLAECEDDGLFLEGSTIGWLFVRGELTSSAAPAMTYGVGAYEFRTAPVIDGVRGEHALTAASVMPGREVGDPAPRLTTDRAA